MIFTASPFIIPLSVLFKFDVVFLGHGLDLSLCQINSIALNILLYGGSPKNTCFCSVAKLSQTWDFRKFKVLTISSNWFFLYVFF